MADFGSPVSGGVCNPAAAYVNVVPSATIHTKGPWVDLFTPDRTGVLCIGAESGQSYTSHRTVLFDLAIGASGSEQVFLSNLMLAYSDTGLNGSRMSTSELVLPVTLPKGALIRARCQSSYASHAGACLTGSCYNLPSSWTGSVIDTYGATVASSAGTTLTADGATLVYGPYSTLSASCERAECFFVAVSARGSQNNLGQQLSYWQLAVGAAGSEQVIATGTFGAGQVTNNTTPQWFGPYYVQVAPGQRLSARASRMYTAQKLIDIIAYGVR